MDQKGKITYVLAEACLVQIAVAFYFAVIVGALRILIQLEGALARRRHVRAHERSCVLLELSALGLDFKLIVGEEGCCVFAVNAGFGVHVGRLLCSLSSFDCISWLGSLFTIECRLISLEN